MPELFAAFICMLTGIRSACLSCRRLRTLMPMRQLWQPVSAMAETGVWAPGEWRW